MSNIRGAEEMLYAWDIFSKKHKNVHLIICGRHQPDTMPLEESSLKILYTNKSITYQGYQDDVRPYFIASDAFVLPSHREGLPNVLLQAGALEIPIVCTDILGNTDVVTSGKNGIIVKKNDVNDLVRGMEEIMLNSSLNQNLKSNARNMITSRYDRNKILAAYLEEYRTLLNSKKITNDIK